MTVLRKMWFICLVIYMRFRITILQAMLFPSVDQGKSWGELCAEPSHANFHGLAADPQQAGALYVGTDTGDIWHVDTNEKTDTSWHQLAVNLPAVLSIVV